MKHILCLIVLLFTPLNLFATEMTNHVLKQSGLEERGVGMRSKFFIDLYEARLYTTPAMPESHILTEKGSIAVSLEIVSSLITSEKMEEATREGFEKSLQGSDQFTAEINEFIAVFKEEIVEGDLFTFYARGVDIEIFKNTKLLASFGTPGFRNALFGIWLGDDPVSKSLKKKMLRK